MTIKLSVTIPLAVPVTVALLDGKTAERTSITLRRPNVGNAKALAVLLGPELARLLMSEVSAGRKDVDIGQIVDRLAVTLMTNDSLDLLTSVIANMAQETKDFIDRLDWLDLAAIGKALLDFFPALQSIVHSSSPQT